MAVEFIIVCSRHARRRAVPPTEDLNVDAGYRFFTLHRKHYLDLILSEQSLAKLMYSLFNKWIPHGLTLPMYLTRPVACFDRPLLFALAL